LTNQINHKLTDRSRERMPLRQLHPRRHHDHPGSCDKRETSMIELGRSSVLDTPPGGTFL
jgi:hypothetical protein